MKIKVNDYVLDVKFSFDETFVNFIYALFSLFIFELLSSLYFKLLS